MQASDDQFERDFWGTCSNSYNEETKQLLYLREMGFKRKPDWRSPWWFDGEGRSFIDIGGGPTSVLLKFVSFNRHISAVVDPNEWPNWVIDRYLSNGIGFYRRRGEDLAPMPHVDVALIYNCLQHVESPEKVIANARAAAKSLRVFEWINVPPHDGHPHMLTAAKLDEWAGRKGVVKQFNGQNECFGTAWILGAP